MKNNEIFENVSILLGVHVFILFLICSCTQQPQLSETEQAIAEIRKGELVIKAKAGAEVKVEQLQHEFWFGAAIANHPFNGGMSDHDARMYKEKFLENFNSASTENALKWRHMERERGDFDFQLVEDMLAWTDANDIPLRGHNIYWGSHQWVQSWIMELGDDELLETLKNRGEMVAERYKGRFAEYDLNNEMIHGNYYEDRFGPLITKQMSDWVHSKDPGANLSLNEYDITTGVMLDEYMANIRRLLGQGVKIATLGVQGHLHGNTFDRDELKRSLDSLAIFNIPVLITEFNVPGQTATYKRDDVLTEEQELQKAVDIVDFYTICFAYPIVKGIIAWGFWEGNSAFRHAYLYKTDWTPAPALEYYQNLIYKTWWTTESGKTNKKGEYSTPAFYGKYKVTVDGASKTVSLKKSEGKVIVDFT